MCWKSFIVAIILSSMFVIEIQGEEKGYICSWVYDDNQNITYQIKEIPLQENISDKEKLIFIFDKFFKQCNNDNINFVPENTELIDVELNEGHLNIYVSSEIKSYGGGSAWEIALVEGILRTGFSFPKVQDITLYIGGQVDSLPEGITLDEYRREDYIWSE